MLMLSRRLNSLEAASPQFFEVDIEPSSGNMIQLSKKERKRSFVCVCAPRFSIHSRPSNQIVRGEEHLLSDARAVKFSSGTCNHTTLPPQSIVTHGCRGVIFDWFDGVWFMIARCVCSTGSWPGRNAPLFVSLCVNRLSGT